jgi:hypothetical protein
VSIVVEEEIVSEGKAKKPEPRWWRPYWVVIVIATIALGIIIPLFSKIPLDRALTYLIIALVAEGVAYYGRVRPSVKLNRVMYILLGVPIGFVFWFISMLFLSRIYIFNQGDLTEDIAIVVSLIVCFGAGAWIGDLIGSYRDYKGPEQYQP